MTRAVQRTGARYRVIETERLMEGLLRKDRWTAVQLADHFGLSPKTIHRYLDVLSCFLPIEEESIGAPGKHQGTRLEYWIDSGNRR